MKRLSTVWLASLLALAGSEVTSIFGWVPTTGDQVLGFIRDNGIRNVIWVTADVHYTAAHYYDPNRAQFQEFAPFWEFVSGPINAGTYGPSTLDNTFGPEVKFMKVPPDGQANLPPSDGLQFFGQIDIDGASEMMTVRLKDLSGATLFTQELAPEV